MRGTRATFVEHEQRAPSHNGPKEPWRGAVLSAAEEGWSRLPEDARALFSLNLEPSRGFREWPNARGLIDLGGKNPSRAFGPPAGAPRHWDPGNISASHFLRLLPLVPQGRQQHRAVLARRSAGRRQDLAEQHRAGTGASLPIPAVADWPASSVRGEGPPLPGRMGQANCCCGSREALADAEPVLSADVRLTRGRKRSERRLLLLQEEVVVAKLQRGTTLRPQLRLALDQLWVLSGGKEAAGEEEEEEEGSDEDRTSIILIWPTSSCVAAFGSQALKEQWVGTLLGTPEGAKRARVTRLPSIKTLEKELSCHHGLSASLV
ncbi:uncharacterized protein LOC115336083 [Aquila chrysaetos chrysaetos]|uniref:uncharacterized protein LOC115336083 n=1 Tax=Aquila chrysaetos chrysaetos TaxID=223781 RepID=UPI0011772BE1|nr:uncharacterized protein LOC115336083 [Aquila chrysaetos chrysaetos]